jgi:acyl dehydratase
MIDVKSGLRFSSEVTLNPTLISEFAKAAGDYNPMHHDPQFAAKTRFKRLIASGTHMTSLLLGLSASYFSEQRSMIGLEFWQRFKRPVFADETIKIGLEFWQRFKRPVFADETIKLEWLVIKVTPNKKLNGDVVELRGRIKGSDGQTAVGAKGRVLVTDKL